MKLKLTLLSLFIVCSIQAQDLHTDANAVSILNEANSTSGWTQSSTVNTSDATDSQNGLYSMKIVSNDGQNDSGRYKYDVVNGTTYTIRIWAKRGAQGTTQTFKNWTALANFLPQDVTSTTWTEYVFTVTASATAKAQIRAYAAGSGGNAGDELFIDAVSITEASSDSEPPSAVTSLAASNTTSSSTDLTWTASTDNVGVTNYEVFQNGTPIGFSAGATTFNVTGLAPSSNFNFTVLARDAAGNISAAGNIVNVTTLADTESPTAVTTLVASNTTANTTDLSWTASTDNVAVTDYEVFQDAVSIGFTGGATVFNVTGLSPITSYDFTVLARDAIPNISAAGNTVNVTTSAAPDSESPSAVTTLAASNITFTSTDLSWTASTDNVGVTDYEVFQDGLGIGFTGGATSFNVTGLISGTSYNFTVLARDAALNISAAGNIVNVTTLTDTQAPTAVNTLAASNTTSTSTDLTWTASTDNVGVTDYEVFQDAVSIGFTGGVTAFNVSGLSALVSYDFTVLARDAVPNISSAGNTVNITTLGATDYTSANSNLPTVDWQARDLFADRNIGIGTTDTQGYRLAVAGNVVAEEIKVALQVNWPDFVFEKSYSLPTLKEVEEHIQKFGHLINIPSATEVAESGIQLGEMNAKLLQKIEELTLYAISQEKKIEQDQLIITQLLKRLDAVEAILKDKK